MTRDEKRVQLWIDVVFIELGRADSSIQSIGPNQLGLTRAKRAVATANEILEHFDKCSGYAKPIPEPDGSK
jgi:hypothetical protein